MSDMLSPLSTLVTRVQGGGTPSRAVSTYWHGPIPWASVKDLTKQTFEMHDTIEHISPKGLSSSSASLIPAGTPIVSTRMAVGKTVIPTVDVAINQDLKALYPAPHVDSRYLTHVLQFIEPRIDAVSVGSTVRGISVDQLMRFRVLSPPLSEQQRIAEVIDTLDDHIHATEQILSKLELARRGLLIDLLTRGIDGKGKLRDLASYASDFTDSPIGKLPRAWQVKPLEDLLAPVSPAMRSGPFGSALLKHELVDAGVPLLGIDNVHIDRFASDYVRFVAPAKAQDLARYRVRPRDVMITIMGTVGRACLVPDDIGEALSSKHVWTMSFDQERYLPYLVSIQLNHSPWARAHLRKDEQGGIMSAIRSDTLRSLLLPVPPIEEQYRIASILQETDKRIAKEAVELAKLRFARNGVANDLLTGRVRVPLEARS